MREAKPRHRRTIVTAGQIRDGFASGVDERGDSEQKAKIAENNISADQSVSDQPILSESGDSLTIMMPRSNRASARPITCRTTFQRGSPFSRREPRANGIDMPTMKRNAGNTRSTKVMPLPFSL